MSRRGRHDTWSVTWRDIIVPLLCPHRTHAWRQVVEPGIRQLITLNPSRDAPMPPRRPRRQEEPQP